MKLYGVFECETLISIHRTMESAEKEKAMGNFYIEEMETHDDPPFETTLEYQYGFDEGYDEGFDDAVFIYKNQRYAK